MTQLLVAANASDNAARDGSPPWSIASVIRSDTRPSLRGAHDKRDKIGGVQVA
jgi:hypothetical protein